MPIGGTIRRRVQAALFPVLVAWGAWTGILAFGHFYSFVHGSRGQTAWIVLAVLAALSGLLSDASIRRPTAGDAGRMPHPLLLVAGLVATSFALYFPALSLGLLSDDFVLLSRAARHEFWSASQFFRPLPLLCWAAVDRLGMPIGPSLHAINVLLHGVNAALLVLVARRFGLRRNTAIAAGVLFLTFPASVEAVAWASGIQDVLLTTCGLAFVLACSIKVRSGWAFAVALVCLTLALATKETAVVLPLLAFTAWFARKGDRWQWRAAAGGLVLAGVYATFRLAGIGTGDGFAVLPSRYFLKELVSRPFATLAVPFTGPELQRFPAVGVALAWLFTGALVLATQRWRSDDVGFGRVARSALWVALCVAPIYSMLFVSADLQGSRYLYLAAAGWSILLVSILVDDSAASQWRRIVGMAATGAVLAVSLAGVRSHLADWQEAARLRDAVLASATAHLQQSPCDVVHFANLPDSVAGAYVFRNGFMESLQGTDLKSRAAVGTGEPRCTVEWNGRSFQ